ncbi:MAG: sugar nucleotide-binding protein [Candidatus Heimdallarchaeota archaeon]|nr:sugar nucleotide-binding protein [Candidatus Heimdallarchaeota archaeon]
MQRVLILGGTGFVGSYIIEEYVKRLTRGIINIEIHASTTRDIASFSFYKDYVEWYQLDLRHNWEKKISILLEEVEPEIIINCMALTFRQSKDKPELANIINNLVVQSLAESVQLLNTEKSKNIRMYHLSTSNVFDNVEGPSDEDRLPDAVQPYGLSKLEGEKHITKLGINGSIVRVTSVWGRKKLDFQHSNILLDLLKKVDRPTVYTDVYRTPTAAPQVAEALIDYIYSEKTLPILHLSENNFETFADHFRKLPEDIHKKFIYQNSPPSTPKKLGLVTKYPELSKALNLKAFLHNFS